jgi:hypothetical protein
MRVQLTVVALGATLVAGCSSASSSAPENPFPLSVVSDTGQLRLQVSAASAPVVGTNAVEFAVTRTSDETPIDGLQVTVVPWMPAMDHGTASPAVTQVGGGKYSVKDLYFFMPGTWQLQTSFSGPLTDHATLTFQLQ